MKNMLNQDDFALFGQHVFRIDADVGFCWQQKQCELGWGVVWR